MHSRFASPFQFCSRRMDKETGEQRWVWTVKLFLEDATARLGVLLWDADAVKFFAGGGLQACDLRACPQVRPRRGCLLAHGDTYETLLFHALGSRY